MDFALIVIAGNLTAYLSLKPIVERDVNIIPRWILLKTWLDEDKYHRWPRFMRSKLRNLSNLLPLIFSRADVVIIHGYETYIHFGFLHWLLRRKSKVIYYYDGMYTADGKGFGSGIPGSSTGYRGQMQQIALRQTDLFVPWSHCAADRTADVYQPARARTVVIHPGIDLDEWPLRQPSEAGHTFALLFVGADAQRKGLDVLLDAYEAGLHESCVLRIVTSRAELPESLHHRIVQLGNASLHFDVTPGSAEMHDLYNMSDALVLPTRLDLSSWVAIEAMATGVPVIATAVGGIPEIVIDDTTGLLVGVDDSVQLTSAVNRLRTNASLQQRLTLAGRRHIESCFNARRNGPELLATVKGLASGSVRNSV